jgi:hypothetical protein
LDHKILVFGGGLLEKRRAPHGSKEYFFETRRVNLEERL